jgi:hypothetical protein
VDLPTSIIGTLPPLRGDIEVLDEELTRADETFEQLVAGNPVLNRLTTLPASVRLPPARMSRR